MAVSVVLSVVSVIVTPRVAKKGGMLFVVIDCLVAVGCCCLLHYHAPTLAQKHLFFILVVQISNILPLFRNYCKSCTLGTEITINDYLYIIYAVVLRTKTDTDTIIILLIDDEKITS